MLSILKRKSINLINELVPMSSCTDLIAFLKRIFDSSFCLRFKEPLEMNDGVT